MREKADQGLSAVAEYLSRIGASLPPCNGTRLSALTADVPYTPRAEKVFRSACIPAPPDGSDPAIVNADMYLFVAMVYPPVSAACICCCFMCGTVPGVGTVPVKYRKDG